MRLDALLFGAHPDDVELTSGGLAALLASHGHAVGLVDLTRGEAGSRGTTAVRAREAEAASKVLGAGLRRNLGLADTGLDGRDRKQIAAVVQCLREHRPSLVVAPDRHDPHPDHVEASNLIARACHLSGLAKFEAPGERFRPERLLFALYRSIRRPRLIVDITPVWEKRVEALAEHRSQFEGEGASTYLTASGFLAEVEARARVFGAAIGAQYGEAFRVAGPLAVRDARVLLGGPS
jgi:bacillithiol biosynthesis deacetylase BshB1